MPILSMFYTKRLANLHFIMIYYGISKLIAANTSSCKWPIFPAKKQRKKLSLIDKYNKDRYGHIIVMENICFKKYLCINWSFSHWKRDARKKESQPRNNDKHQLENTFLCHSKAHSTHSLSTTWAIVYTWYSMDHNTCDP